MKQKILWISFRQTHLESYRSFFSKEDRFLHKMVSKKIRHPRYWFLYFLSLLKVMMGKYPKKSMHEMLQIFEECSPRRASVWDKTKLAYWYSWSNRLLEKESPDAIILWGGLQTFQIALSSAASQKSIRVFYLENGYLPNTTQLEEFGVNWRSNLKNLPRREAYQKKEVSEETLNKIFSLPIIPRERRKVSSLVSNNQSIFANSDLPRRYVFVPFQVSKDSQIQLYSPWLRNMGELLEAAWEGVSQYNQENKDNLVIVVKEHPSDFGRVNYGSLRKHWEQKGVLFYNDFSTSELIEKSWAIITINSSVGAEGLLRKKPVIVLGKAVYSRPGVTLEANSPSGIREALVQIESADFQEDLEAFLCYLYENRLVQGHWKTADAAHWKNLENRLFILLQKKEGEYDQ